MYTKQISWLVAELKTINLIKLKKIWNLYNFAQVSYSVWFDTLCPSQQFFSYVEMGLPGLNQY